MNPTYSPHSVTAPFVNLLTLVTDSDKVLPNASTKYRSQNTRTDVNPPRYAFV